MCIRDRTHARENGRNGKRTFQNITEKEAYAIYKSVKRLTFYITGAKTTVFSDHKPLKNFFEGGMKVAKLDRWSLELQEFDISLELIKAN